MLELLTLFKSLEYFSQNENFAMNNSDTVPTSWIVIAFIIAFGTAYIAFTCNENETPATRFLSTIIAFFLSGFYLIYYFIYHVLFGRDCGSGRRINNVVRNIIKKK